VHGGPLYSEPHVVNAAVLDTLLSVVEFAPNHLPDEIALVDAVGRRWPAVPQIVCFDTAFHARMPEVARRLPIARAYDDAGVRRYGFHGLSFEFLAGELERVGGSGARNQRAVLAHLGGGSSLAALQGGRSVDTTMGLTPIGGVLMSTRSGDLDPGVVTWIGRKEGLTPDQVEDLLSRRAGLAAISGGVADMRTLLERQQNDPACRLAVDMYVHSIRKAIGALTAILGGVDTLVFSGGIGEHAPEIRRRICERFEFLGIEIDDGKNAASAAIVSTPASRVAIRVIATDEELMIVRSAFRLLGAA
jgi:acetate kinase